MKYLFINYAHTKENTWVITHMHAIGVNYDTKQDKGHVHSLNC
jgi:hypothetical protein